MLIGVVFVEIERKFLCKSHPDLSCLSNQMNIQQNYMYTSGFEELRIRKVDFLGKKPATIYSMTHKLGSGLEREETEFSITERLYELTNASIIHRPLSKTRFLIIKDLDCFTHMDEYSFYPVFDRYSHGPMVIEVEFKDKETANSFIPPLWFGTEVTGDRLYSAASMWEHLQ